MATVHVLRKWFFHYIGNYKSICTPYENRKPFAIRAYIYVGIYNCLLTLKMASLTYTKINSNKFKKDEGLYVQFYIGIHQEPLYKKDVFLYPF